MYLNHLKSAYVSNIPIFYNLNIYLFNYYTGGLIDIDYVSY